MCYILNDHVRDGTNRDAKTLIEADESSPVVAPGNRAVWDWENAITWSLAVADNSSLPLCVLVTPSVALSVALVVDWDEVARGAVAVS